MDKKIVRCAIYTRKSTEEGLDQTFNTLHAQREACEAYIQSQLHEGWISIPTLYDDGGFSGGTMNRPALTRLLADTEAGLIDTVVVYKIDRLTRSLADFAKMVEIFDDPKGDGNPVSFVSVTQQFNTTTSMGRLTLNVLLSFAQFEREVIGERVRDKIAASKKKGMWMGGLLPLGYDAEDKLLKVNKAEAKTVREIFDSYKHLKSVHELKQILDEQGVVSKKRISKAGNHSGGKPLCRGAIYTILRNPVYIGKTRHNSKVYDGQHEAIVDIALWQKVQDILDENQVRQKAGVGCKNSSLLAGLIFDENNNRLTPTHAVKKSASGGKKRYRYYISQPLTNGTSKAKGLRLPASDIEQIVIVNICAFLNDEKALHGELHDFITTSADIESLNSNRKHITSILKDSNNIECAALLKQLLHSVTVNSDDVILQISIAGLAQKLIANSEIKTGRLFEINIAAKLKRCGMEMKLILGETMRQNKVDVSLVKNLSNSQRLVEQLTSNDNVSVADIARQEGWASSYITRLLKFATLSPRIQEAILEGTQPPELTANRIMRMDDLPIKWEAQEAALGF